jgi:signal transduction histidine kinase
MEDERASIRLLRAVASLGVLFLIAETLYQVNGVGISRRVMSYHLVAIALMCGVLAVTWSARLRRYWKLWNLILCTAVGAVLIAISSETGEHEPLFIALVVLPFVTASFVSWGRRWQAVMGLCCIALYAVGEYLSPVPRPEFFSQWLGLVAAVMLAQCTAVSIERYRTHLREQLEQLVQASAFRESQMATMAHDIRSPIAALAGLADLLEDESLDEKDRRGVLARIGATLWTTDLTVSNVLDLYQLQDGRLTGAPVRLDPNKIIADAAASCRTQAARKGLGLVVDCGKIPPGDFDPRQLQKVVRNLLACLISRLTTGQVTLKTYSRDGALTVEVEDDGPAPSREELADMLANPDRSGAFPRSMALGLYVARTIAEGGGGRVEATRSARGGLRLVAELWPVGGRPAPPAAES